MNEGAYKLWDIFIKAVGGAAIVGGAVWGTLSYRQTTEHEFRRPLWDRQLSLYFDATDAAATVATLSDGDARSDAIKKFWTLYYGPLVVVEDPENVNAKMIAFGECLTKPGESKPHKNCSVADLRQLAIDLARSCRQSIGESWDKKLASLRRAPQRD